MPDTMTLELIPVNRMQQGYSEEEKIRIKATVIELISGGMPEAVACRSIPELPTVQTLKVWRDEDEDFALSIAHARLLGHDSIAVDCIDIADHAREDTYTDEDGNERTNSEVIQRSKLRVETRLKLLSKWDPKRYGDKVTHDVTTKSITVNIDTTLTPEAASEAYKELMG